MRIEQLRVRACTGAAIALLAVISAAAPVLAQAPAPARAQAASPAPAVMARVPARATLRAAPSDNAAMVTLVAAGTQVEVLGREGDYVKVLLPPDSRRVRLAGYLMAREVILAAPVGGKPGVSAGGAGAAASRGRKPGRLGPVGYRLFGEVSYVSFLAADTFGAIFETSRLTAPGGGGEVTFGPNLFARVGLSRMRREGRRAWVYNGEVFRLKTPLTATMTPVDLTAGWALRARRGFRPYVGGGFGFFTYQEVSELASTGENVDTSHTSYHLLAGAEYAVWKRIALGGEFQYRSVPGIIGTAGVSKEFAETDLGGTALKFRIVIGF